MAKKIVASTDRALVHDMVRAPEPQLEVADPKHIFILSGGIGAGKTTIINRLKTDFHYVSGSPADILKSVTATILTDLLNDGLPEEWQGHFDAMQEQATKAKYRDLLVALGEFVSNEDNWFWANQAVAAAEAEYNTLAAAGVTSGIVFDSMRRPAEILAVKRRWPNARHVHLVVSPARQMDYLTNILGYSVEKAEATLANASEHWLDDMNGTDYDADYVINADEGDDITWAQFLGVVILMMDKSTLELASAITEQPDDD